MKRLFKWLFSIKSKSKKYKYEIILVCYLLLILTIVIILSNIANLNHIVSRVLGIIVLVQWILLFIPCIIRIFDILDYNEKMKVVTGNKQFKFEPLLCNINEIEKWITNAITPDTLYIKSSIENNITIISITFMTRGKIGPFINKQIWINDKEITNIKDIRQEINNTCMIKDDCVYLMAITEYNDPKNFNKIITIR